MTSDKRKQRRIVLDQAPLPTVPENTRTSSQELEALQQLIDPYASYLPLELFLLRRQVRLPEGASLEQERQRLLRACWQARTPVKRLTFRSTEGANQHQYITLPAFPVTVLEECYRGEYALAQPGDTALPTRKPDDICDYGCQ